jgi:prepilin-type N-terminal cleavage/methylation domain-containing protein
MQRVRARTRGEMDAGFTLVEILVTVVILGIGVVGIMSGIGALQKSSDIARAKSQTANLAVSAAEWVIDEGRNPYADSPCVTQYFPAAPAGWAGPPDPPRFAPDVAAAARNTIPIAMPLLADGATRWDPATTLSVQVIGYWNGTTWYEDPGTRIASCQALETSPAGRYIHMQKISVVATSPDGRARESLIVVKRGG